MNTSQAIITIVAIIAIVSFFMVVFGGRSLKKRITVLENKLNITNRDTK